MVSRQDEKLYQKRINLQAQNMYMESTKADPKDF